MTLFKKIKALINFDRRDSGHGTQPSTAVKNPSDQAISAKLGHRLDDQLDNSDETIENLADGLLTHLPPPLPSYLSSVTNTIEAWLNEQNWHYRRYDPHSDDEFRTHHLVTSFADTDFEWNCLFRINEKNQLISIIGILIVDVPTSHYLNLFAKISEASANINFGSIEFDLRTGDIRTKMYLDAEFTHLNDRVLGTFMQGLAGLTQHAHSLYQDAISQPPIKSAKALVASQNIYEDIEDGFFAPSLKAQ